MRLRNMMWTCLAATAIALAATGLAGCGASLPAAANPEQGRAALRSSLDAWKSGAALDSTRGQTPPVVFRDEDWKAGWKLKDYRFTLDDEAFGQQRRFYVHLTLANAKGQNVAKEVQYLVDTAPALVVLRVSD